MLSFSSLLQPMLSYTFNGQNKTDLRGWNTPGWDNMGPLINIKCLHYLMAPALAQHEPKVELSI